MKKCTAEAYCTRLNLHLFIIVRPIAREEEKRKRNSSPSMVKAATPWKGRGWSGLLEQWWHGVTSVNRHVLTIHRPHESTTKGTYEKTIFLNFPWASLYQTGVCRIMSYIELPENDNATCFVRITVRNALFDIAAPSIARPAAKALYYQFWKKVSVSEVKMNSRLYQRLKGLVKEQALLSSDSTFVSRLLREYF